ncbi:MAG: hypothetical protein QXQ81_05565, partial [Candidatus Thorarchaeota archaeon]
SAAVASIVIAHTMSRRGWPRWQCRKLVHVLNGSVIGLTVVRYSSLSGPVLAAVIFLSVIAYACAHKSTLLSELLMAGSREGETRWSTFMAGFMGLFSFAICFVLFLHQPAIITAAILSVSWADGAGEVFGRLFGGHLFDVRIGKKSLEGSIAVFSFSCISVLVSLFMYADIEVMAVVPPIALVGIVVTMSELLSRRWVDNFLIPVVTSFSMWIMLFPGTPML